jgi:hypothetical protein
MREAYLLPFKGWRQMIFGDERAAIRAADQKAMPR